MSTAKYALFLLIASIPYAVYHMWVSKNMVIEYDFSFYFSADNLRKNFKSIHQLVPIGAFYAFKLFWFFPLYIIYRYFTAENKLFMWLIISIIVMDFLQLAIAYDITRMLCIGFPAILLSAERVKTLWSPQRFTRSVFILVLVNFLVIQYFVSYEGANPLLPFPYKVFMRWVGLMH